jgi:hypothetical protein
VTPKAPTRSVPARILRVLTPLLAAALLGGAPASAAGGLPVLPQLLPSQQPAPAASPFDGSGMWLWYVSRSDGGNVDSIAARAHAAGVGTLFVKSSDGRSWWSQFSPALVAALKARGLRVCAWQYVYGNSPTAEARLGRRAVQSGADCLVIDAEAQYEGKYAQAATYMRKLRAYVGPGYPVGLAGFPYVDYHPAFPYSIFLGPGGAQFNLPQMYWRDIGTTVDAVYSHTFSFNQLYGRPIYPLGQLYNGPSRAQLLRFRQLAVAYGARGTSWWDWQETSFAGWAALAAPLAPLAPAAALGPPAPTLARGTRGDLVVWVQQHLLAAGQPVRVNGVYDARTIKAVRSVQAVGKLPASGAVDPGTWQLLLSRPAAKVSWRHGLSAAAAGPNGPRSASLPPVRDEIHSKLP